MMRCTFVSEDVDDERDVPLSVRMWVMRCTFVSEDVDDEMYLCQ